VPEKIPTMMYPPIEALIERGGSKFTLVTMAGRRAREITTYFSQLGQGLGAIVPPQVASLSHKPVSIALEEIYEGRIIGVYRTEDTAPGDTPVDPDVTPGAEAGAATGAGA
jgi:DNA-directed RNA polymerase subunit omega